MNRKVKFLLWILPVWLGLFPANIALAEVRTWTSSDGKSIKAEQTGLDTGNKTVTLKLDTGKLYTLPLAKLSPDDIVTAMQWKPAASPVEASPFPCLLGTSRGDADSFLGEPENDSCDRGDYYAYGYIDPHHPTWTAGCVFDQHFKCVEVSVTYTYRPKNALDKPEFPELFHQWMVANSQGGKWIGNGENSWMNDQTGATATQSDYVSQKDDGGDGEGYLHIATLKILEKNWASWLTAKSQAPRQATGSLVPFLPSPGS
jgi:hypothetical protein